MFCRFRAFGEPADIKVSRGATVDIVDGGCEEAVGLSVLWEFAKRSTKGVYKIDYAGSNHRKRKRTLPRHV